MLHSFYLAENTPLHGYHIVFIHLSLDGHLFFSHFLAFGIVLLLAQLVRNLPAVQETWVRFLGRENPLEKEMATQSNILVWRIPRTEDPGRLQSYEVARVGHDLATKLLLL